MWKEIRNGRPSVRVHFGVAWGDDRFCKRREERLPRMQGTWVWKKATVQGGWIEQDTQDTEGNTDSVSKKFWFF